MLDKKQKAINNFDGNFEKLKELKIDQKYLGLMKAQPVDLFSKEELVSWMNDCQRRLLALRSKFKNVQVNFDSEFSSLEIKIKQSLIAKDSISLHDMSLSVLV